MELVRLSADVSAKDDVGNSPQDLASQSQKINLRDLLVQREVCLKRKKEIEIASYLRKFLWCYAIPLARTNILDFISDDCFCSCPLQRERTNC